MTYILLANITPRGRILPLQVLPVLPVAKWSSVDPTVLYIDSILFSDVLHTKCLFGSKIFLWYGYENMTLHAFTFPNDVLSILHKNTDIYIKVFKYNKCLVWPTTCSIWIKKSKGSCKTTLISSSMPLITEHVLIKSVK